MGLIDTITNLAHMPRDRRDQLAQRDAQTRLMQAQANSAEQQGQIMTAADKQALLGMGKSVDSDGNVTEHEIPNVPRYSMSNQPESAPNDWTPTSDPLTRVGAGVNVSRPADPSRMFTFKHPSGDLSVELSPDYPTLHHALLESEIRKATANVPIPIPGTDSTVMATPQEAVSHALNPFARMAGTQSGWDAREALQTGKLTQQQKQFEDLRKAHAESEAARAELQMKLQEMKGTQGLGLQGLKNEGGERVAGIGANARVTAAGITASAPNNRPLTANELRQTRKDKNAADMAAAEHDAAAKTGFYKGYPLKPQEVEFHKQLADQARRSSQDYQAQIDAAGTAAPSAGGAGNVVWPSTANKAAAAAPGAGAGKPLQDPTIAKRYLQKAGGDANRARQMAQADGWTF